MVEWEHANRDLPYQDLVQKLRPYRRLLFASSVGSMGFSMLLIGGGTTEQWRAIPFFVGIILWCFYLIAFWFDPDDGPFVRPARLSDPPPRVSPWVLAFWAPVMILLGFAALIFLIVASPLFG